MAKTVSRKTIREAAADECGLVIFCTADSVDTTAKTVTISKLADASPNPEWLKDSYLTKDGSTYRRIRSYDGTKVQLTDNLAGLVNGDSCQIYFLLTPEDLNALLDRDLQTELVTQHRTAIALAAGDNEYDLPTDVENTTDIIDITFRDTSSGTLVWEGEVGGVRFTESDNGLTVVLPHLPPTVANVSLVILHRKRYSALATDAATTTCPFDLAWTQLAVSLVNKISTKYGQGVGQKFNQVWARNNQKLQKLRAKHLPPITGRDFTWDNDFQQDIPMEILEGSW